MKRYVYCFLILIVASLACIVVAYSLTRYYVRQEEALPGTEVETETVDPLENRAAVGHQQIKARLETQVPQEFYLVSESGFLLVFSKDQSTICLYTHIPVTDFPASERHKLMEGIWFPSMMEVYHYLESYTS